MITARLRLFLFILVPGLGGVVALLSGMDASWDLRNYHYYNGWALLTGHLGRDMLVSQTPSFYNPVGDLPFAWGAGHLPARILAFATGTLQGGNFILLTLLGESLLTGETPLRRLLLAAFLAVAGCAGAVALSEFGTAFNDLFTSLGLFGSLIVLARRWDRITEGRAADAALAGLPIGLAFGLKLTMAPYLAAFGLALLLCVPGGVGRRFRVASLAGLGALAGTLLTGGFWMAHLWELYGNPMFPYFNQVFHSPWGLPGDNRDLNFMPRGGFWRWALFPWYFTLNSRVSNEISFFDMRVLALYVLAPLAPFIGFARDRRAALLMTTLAIGYAIWLAMFAIYRYLLPTELLAPLAVTLILQGLKRPWNRASAALVVGAMIVTTSPASWLRVPFSDRAVEVGLPPIENPEHSLVLMAGHEPLSFLIPAFPDSLRFIRIDSTFTNPEQTTVPFNAKMKEMIDRHDGPFLALFIPHERHDVIKRLGNVGLVLIPETCQPVTSPIEAEDYALCGVERS